MSAKTHGQALVVVALSLGILLALAIGGLDIALARRAHAQLANALTVAALDAQTTLRTDDLVRDQVRLDPNATALRMRARLRVEFGQIAGMIDADGTSERATIVIAPPGADCFGKPAAAWTICATARATVRGALGERNVEETVRLASTEHP